MACLLYTARVGVMALAYCISAFMDCTIAASRGLGKTVVPTVIVIMGSCVFRVIWVVKRARNCRPNRNRPPPSARPTPKRCV